MVERVSRGVAYVMGCLFGITYSKGVYRDLGRVEKGNSLMVRHGVGGSEGDRHGRRVSVSWSMVGRSIVVRHSMGYIGVGQGRGVQTSPGTL